MGWLRAQLCPTFCDPMDHQALLSMGFPRQEYWNGLPFPPLGDLPDSGIFLIHGSNLHLLHWQADSLPTPEFLGFPCCSAGKESAWNARDVASIPGLGRSLGEGKGYPLKYTGLEKSKDCVAHGVAKSRTRLSNFTSLLTTEPPGKPHI